MIKNEYQGFQYKNSHLAVAELAPADVEDKLPSGMTPDFTEAAVAVVQHPSNLFMLVASSPTFDCTFTLEKLKSYIFR